MVFPSTLYEQKAGITKYSLYLEFLQPYKQPIYLALEYLYITVIMLCNIRNGIRQCFNVTVSMSSN